MSGARGGGTVKINASNYSHKALRTDTKEELKGNLLFLLSH